MPALVESFFDTHQTMIRDRVKYILHVDEI
jgi:hypothetical protein